MTVSLLPESVAVAGWIPFAVVLLLSLLFSTLYIRHFRNVRESEASSTCVTILALAVSLLTSLLLPVDVFLVSYMKTSNGTFQDWADNSTFRETIESSVLYAYYALYGVVLFFVFFMLPMMYFFYEEKDDYLQTSIPQRICTALKYTSVFMLLAIVLFLVGAFIPLKGLPDRNTTEWEKIEFLIDELSQSRGEDALSFVLNILTLFGMFIMVFYTGSGLSIWPIEMIKGKRNAKTEYEDMLARKSSAQAQIATIRQKYNDPRQKMSRRDGSRIAELEEEERLIDRQENHLSEAKQSWLQKFRPFLRPFQISLGIAGGLLALLFWISLLLSNIDKAINSMGYKMGYALPTKSLPNPLDFVLVEAQKVFPIDYILFTALVCFLVVCTISGIQQIGIWFFFLKMYKIRSHKTRPQGLIMLCASLMYAVLALNILVCSTSPQYTTYGSQMYHPNETESLEPCSSNAFSDECIMTRISTLMLRFFYKAWFFGAFYYWATWVFICVSLVAFIVAIVRKQRSAIAGLVENDDLEDSDDDDTLIRA